MLAFDAIHRRPSRGIPTWMINVMEWRMLDRLAGASAGAYEREPVRVYRDAIRNVGCCMVDQWIPLNPLTMGASGYRAGTERKATTGATEIVRDGMCIESPEDVVAHLEKVEFPRIARAIATFDEPARCREILDKERETQGILGDDILKAPYGCARFPKLRYGAYGYENYFLAYLVYPEVMERDFALQADLAILENRAFVRAVRQGGLPAFIRLDHDMADSRGTLVDVRSLDRLWFPHFDRSLAPLRDAGMRMVWHCDGNLMEMIPRLLAVGLHGFQGFQYEDGMDYERICRMTTREGEPLLILAGVSVTRTLPHGKPEDVRREMTWLVENGPRTGMFLGASSSITPGVPWANLQTLVEGFRYYRKR